MLDKIPGIEMSCEEQKEMLTKCQAQYTEKWWVVLEATVSLLVFKRVGDRDSNPVNQEKGGFRHEPLEGSGGMLSREKF